MVSSKEFHAFICANSTFPGSASDCNIGSKQRKANRDNQYQIDEQKYPAPSFAARYGKRQRFPPFHSTLCLIYSHNSTNIMMKKFKVIYLLI